MTRNSSSRFGATFLRGEDAINELGTNDGMEIWQQHFVHYAN